MRTDRDEGPSASPQRAFSIRMAELGDAVAIGAVGTAAYAESYGHMWDDAAGYSVWLETFGPASAEQFLRRHDTATWVAEAGGRVTGFLSMVIGSPDPVDGRTDGAEIPRIYLLAPARGRGAGKLLLDAASADAASRGIRHLWLDAMEAAPWAWTTYERWGFSRIGASTFPGPIGPSFKSMAVMRKALRTAG